MKHTQQRRSNCPINFALETFGDPWSLLIIRDIVYFYYCSLLLPESAAWLAFPSCDFRFWEVFG